jgi:hypothetical protein
MHRLLHHPVHRDGVRLAAAPRRQQRELLRRSHERAQRLSGARCRLQQSLQLCLAWQRLREH